jgi:hypothetical protein
MLTRQFLPGYFQPPLPGLDHGERQGITQCCKTANGTENLLRYRELHL